MGERFGIADFQTPVDQHGPLGQFDWATQGVNGTPVQAPVEPFNQDPGFAGASARGVQALGGQTNATGSGSGPVGEPSYSRSGPGGQPEPGQGSSDPVQEALRVLAVDPSALTPAQVEIIRRVGAMGALPGTGASSTSTTTQQRIAAPGEAASRDKEDEIRGRMAGRVNDLARYQGEDAANSADAAVKYADGLKTQMVDRQRAQAAHAEDMEKLQGDITKAGADYQKAAAGLDPNRLMKGGKGWAGALAMALGAYGGALAKTPNFAQNIIDSALSRDMDAQKTALGAKKENLTLVQQIYQDHRQRFADDSAARQATKADVYDIFAAQAQSRAARAKGTETEINSQNFADNMLLQGQAARTNALQLEAKVRSTTNTASNAGTARGPVNLLDERAKDAEDMTKIKKGFGGGPDGPPTTQDLTHFNKVLEQVSAYGAAMKSGERLRDLNGKTTELGRTIPFSTEAHQQGVAQDDFLSQVLKAQSGATVNPGELQRKEKALVNGKWSSKSRNESVDEALRGVAGKLGSQIATLPASLREEAYKRAAAGGFTPEEIQAMRTMTAPGTVSDTGAALGGRPRE